MTIFEMLGQSAVLTVLGIAVVFGFLAIMVFCVSVLGKFFQAREAASGLAAQEGTASSVLKGAETKGTIAAIAAALNDYSKT